MIKLSRGLAPSQLTFQATRDYARQFFDSGKVDRVWDHDWLKAALLQMSGNTCAYCTCRLGMESTNMHVEHFRHKDKYWRFVMAWANLLPSCEGCNTRKGQYDMAIQGKIIDPTVINPRDHLYFSNFFLRPGGELGTRTRDVFDLNRKQVAMPRYEIGTEIIAKLEDLDLYVREHNPLTPPRARYARRRMLALLDMVQFGEPYAATSGSFLLHHDMYSRVKQKLRELGKWDDEAQELENQAREIALRVSP